MQETWKFAVGLDGYANASITEVSDLGRVRQGNVVITPTYDKDGYAYIYLSKGGHKEFIAHLVLSAFTGPPALKQVCVRTNSLLSDNTLENLRWGSRSEVWAWRKKCGWKPKPVKPRQRKVVKRKDRRATVFDAWLAEYKRLEST